MLNTYLTDLNEPYAIKAPKAIGVSPQAQRSFLLVSMGLLNHSWQSVEIQFHGLGTVNRLFSEASLVPGIGDRFMLPVQ